jgi:hypothetical protein
VNSTSILQESVDAFHSRRIAARVKTSAAEDENRVGAAAAARKSDGRNASAAQRKLLLTPSEYAAIELWGERDRQDEHLGAFQADANGAN